MTIVQLDKSTIEQIAAGEVIESPVSIVKELVENSIDAKAQNIVVEIKNGGKNYIRVTDDGLGIDKKEIELAFKPHATSKISNFDDLYKLFTLGFRGEALSSIVACADLSLISKTKEDKVGSKVSFINNEIVEKKSIATNEGTSIEVFNLFKNLPVRRKFLASDISEANKISRLVHALALGYDYVSFKFIKDERLVFQTVKNQSLKDKILNLLDDNLKNNLIRLDFSNDLYEVKGYISDSNYYRGNRSLQYIFVNNRLIENTNISRAIESSFKSLIPNNRYPAFFISIKTDAKNIDVNIHPNKKEINFSYQGELIDLLKSKTNELLYNNSKINSIQIKNDKKKEINFYNDYADDYSQILNFYNKINDNDEFKIKEDNEKDYDNNSDNKTDDEINFFENKHNEDDLKNYNKENYNQLNFVKENNEYSKKEVKKKDSLDLNMLKYKTSIFKVYSLFSYDDKIIILNHRRAEQKIKFEEYIKDFNKEDISSQDLLEPHIMKINVNDYGKFLEKKDLFKKIGFSIDDFSQDRLVVRSVPIIFENPETIDLFYDLLDIDLENKEIFYKKISKLINKFSFRKGDKIDENEANELLEKLNEYENPFKTYEGKSTMIMLEESELEKYFER